MRLILKISALYVGTTALLCALFLSQIAGAITNGDGTTDYGRDNPGSRRVITYNCVLREAWETPKAPVPFARLDFSRVLHLDWDDYVRLIELLSIEKRGMP